MQYYTNDSCGPKTAVALTLGVTPEEVELGHDGTGFFIIRPEDVTPDPAIVAAQSLPPIVPPPVTDNDIAKQYQQAYQAAEAIIFLLMGRIAPTLVAKKYCTPENVNAEGTRFMQFHRDVISDFKNAGRHPDAGDQMYKDFVDSKGTFSWAEDAAILAIFAATIPRNPK